MPGLREAGNGQRRRHIIATAADGGKCWLAGAILMHPIEHDRGFINAGIQRLHDRMSR